MITTAIINLAFNILSWIINSLPSSSGWGIEATQAMETLGGYVGMFTGILPMATVATCIGIVFLIEISIFGFKTFKWIISHIPWIGGKGA